MSFCTAVMEVNNYGNLWFYDRCWCCAELSKVLQRKSRISCHFNSFYCWSCLVVISLFFEAPLSSTQRADWVILAYNICWCLVCACCVTSTTLRQSICFMQITIWCGFFFSWIFFFVFSPSLLDFNSRRSFSSRIYSPRLPHAKWNNKECFSPNKTQIRQREWEGEKKN